MFCLIYYLLYCLLLCLLVSLVSSVVCSVLSSVLSTVKATIWDLMEVVFPGGLFDELSFCIQSDLVKQQMLPSCALYRVNLKCSFGSVITDMPHLI